jgi:hypothetical protein
MRGDRGGNPNASGAARGGPAYGCAHAGYACYHAVPVEADPGLKPDPAEVVRADWFEPDKLPKAIAFPNHIVSVLRAWQKAFLDGAIVSSLPDRPLSARGR